MIRPLIVCAVALLLVPHPSDALHIPSPISTHHCRNNRRQSSSPAGTTSQSNHYNHIQSLSRISTSSALFAAPQRGLQNPNGDKSPKKWKRGPRKIKRGIKSLFKLLLNFPKRFRTHYKKLSKRGKLILSVQLLALGLIMGLGVKSSRDVRTRAANRPVEVGYSTFLDLVDVNGKGHTPGKNPALRLEGVVISKDRIGFRVTTDAEKHAKAILDKKLVERDDVSVRPVPLSSKSVYAMKPPASEDLMGRLRERGVPFRAASTKASNNAAVAARLSIFALYFLFLKKMYQTMSGDRKSVV